MAIFAKPKSQAAKVMKRLQGTVIESVGTVRNYEQCLSGVAKFMKNEGNFNGLMSMTIDQAIRYLTIRSEEVGQKQLDMDRQAIQMMFTHVTGVLSKGDKLPVVKSEYKQLLQSRAYTELQVNEITKRQRYHNALATRIALAAGLRVHELYT